MKSEIGGYFDLELDINKVFHPTAISLNSARNCVVYILKTQKIKKLYYPSYNCDSVADAIRTFAPDVQLVRYHINELFVPQTAITRRADERILYINYFGLCEDIIRNIPAKNSIIDNAQSFYQMPINEQDTFYSPRKFFGVPDGGYLYTREKSADPFNEDTSYKRTSHLLKRIDNSPSEGYPDFLLAEKSLDGEPIKLMSKLTRRLLLSLDYERIALIRRTNFQYLHSLLEERNQLSLLINTALKNRDFVPFVYPYLSEKSGHLRDKLITNKIFVAKYWPSNLLDRNQLNFVEDNFVTNLLPLPIDQRYGENEMMYISDFIIKLSN